MQSRNDGIAKNLLLESSTVKTTLAPWPHQKEALDKLEYAAQKEDRITAVLACGSGKTALALWFAERLRCQRILILLPSLGLLAQTLQEWLRLTASPQFSYLCVCSDTGVSREVDAFLPNLSELDFRVTTDAQVVRQFLRTDFTEVQLVFSTYHSAPVVAAGMNANRPFDLTIFDEAHKTAGLADHLFAFALEDHRLPSKKRLFMTATPRQYVFRDLETDPELICSMDSVALYGKIRYHLPFADAVERNIICNYQVIIPVITSNQVNMLALHKGQSRVKDKTIPTETLAHYIALQNAVEKQGIQKILSFHSRVKQAKDFKRIGKKIGAEFLPGFQFFHINGEMPTQQRARILRKFEKAPLAVLTNARCLTEGIDIPNVDLVAFLSPKHSRIDIVQAAGRAMRKSPGKKRGYVLLPLYVELSHQESIEAAVLRLDYSDVWETLYALADHDELLASAIRAASQTFMKTGEMDLSQLREKILIETPLMDAQLLQRSIMTLCLEKLRSSWEKRYEELAAYKACYGHCRVPRSFKNKSLASWVAIQRSQYRQGTLRQEKIAKLNTLEFQWEFSIWGWQEGYDALKKYKEEYGHDAISWRGPNKRLAEWIQRQRVHYKKGKLSGEKMNQLQDLDFAWESSLISWKTYYEQLLRYKEEHGNCCVPETQENRNLAAWCRGQRYSREKGTLSQEKMAQLNVLGFEWERPFKIAWERGYQALMQYKQKHGHCNVPQKWLEDTRLANWVCVQRAAYAKGKLKEDKIAQLNALAFEWDRPEETWRHRYAALVQYKKKYGHCNVPQRWPENKILASWVVVQRVLYKKGALSREKMAQLNALEFERDPFEANWQTQYDALLRYKKTYGHCNITNTSCENKSLILWLDSQRACYKKGKLNSTRLALLESLGVTWNNPQTSWETRYQELSAYKKQWGDCQVPYSWQKNQPLANWVIQQRKNYKAKKLDQNRINLLNVLGFRWSAKKCE